jgi:hypothetical protein
MSRSSGRCLQALRLKQPRPSRQPPFNPNRPRQGGYQRQRLRQINRHLRPCHERPLADCRQSCRRHGRDILACISDTARLRGVPQALLFSHTGDFKMTVVILSAIAATALLLMGLVSWRNDEMRRMRMKMRLFY